MGILLIVLSTYPQSIEAGNTLLMKKINHFNLKNYFCEIHATKESYSSKGEYIIEVLNRRRISKKQALMVGDHYNWDYKSAKENGIDALLIESEYMKLYSNKGCRTIKRLKDILKYI